MMLFYHKKMVRKLLNLSLLCWYSKFSFTTSITITHPLNILPLLVYYSQKITIVKSHGIYLLLYFVVRFKPIQVYVEVA